eukprot:2297076-Amphidinium_carterae.1
MSPPANKAGMPGLLAPRTKASLNSNRANATLPQWRTQWATQHIDAQPCSLSVCVVPGSTTDPFRRWFD